MCAWIDHLVRPYTAAEGYRTLFSAVYLCVPCYAYTEHQMKDKHRNWMECSGMWCWHTHRAAHPAPSPSAPEMLIARDRLGHLSLSTFKSCHRDGSRRRSLGILWRETGGPRTGKGTGRVQRGRERWGGSRTERQGTEGVKGSGRWKEAVVLVMPAVITYSSQSSIWPNQIRGWPRLWLAHVVSLMMPQQHDLVDPARLFVSAINRIGGLKLLL